MEVKLKVKLSDKHLFNFLMHHTYSSFSGYIGIIISLCALSAFVMSLNSEVIRIQYKVVLLVTALLFTVVQPLMLKSKAKQQVKKNKSFSDPFEYVINSSGIYIKQNDDELQVRWDEIKKITSTKKCVFIYLTKIRAFIIPREDVGGDMADFRTIINKNCLARHIRIK